MPEFRLIKEGSTIVLQPTGDPFMLYVVQQHRTIEGYEARVYLDKIGETIYGLNIHLIAPMEGKNEERDNE